LKKLTARLLLDVRRNQVTKNKEKEEVMAKKPVKKKAPAGYHYMPNGKLMKDSAMKKKTKKKSGY